MNGVPPGPPADRRAPKLPLQARARFTGYGIDYDPGHVSHIEWVGDDPNLLVTYPDGYRYIVQTSLNGQTINVICNHTAFEPE